MKKLFVLSLLIVASTMIANAQIVTSTSSSIQTTGVVKGEFNDKTPANLLSTSIGDPWEIVSFTHTVARNRNNNGVSSLLNYGVGFNWSPPAEDGGTALSVSTGLRFHFTNTSSLDFTFGGSFGILFDDGDAFGNLSTRVNLNIKKFVIGFCFVPAMDYGRYSNDIGGSLTLGLRF